MFQTERRESYVVVVVVVQETSLCRRRLSGVSVVGTAAVGEAEEGRGNKENGNSATGERRPYQDAKDRTNVYGPPQFNV